jgi:hypothetical protein
LLLALLLHESLHVNFEIHPVGGSLLIQWGGQNEEESQKRFCSLPQDSLFRSASHFSLPTNHPFNSQISSESAHLILKFTPVAEQQFQDESATDSSPVMARSLSRDRGALCSALQCSVSLRRPAKVCVVW